MPEVPEQEVRTIESISNDFRERLGEMEKEARKFTSEVIKLENIEGNKGEVIAQSIIAMRHIEDARMRYGKVIQYLGDGVSKFDK